MSIVMFSLMSLLSASSLAQEPTGAPVVLAQAAEPPPAIPAEPPPAIPAGSPPPPTVAAPPPPAATGPAPLALAGRSYQQGVLDGTSVANSEPMGAWFAAGAGGACIASGIGCLGVTATAGLMEPRPSSIYLSGVSTPGENDYWAGYREGYSKRLRTRRATAAFIGGTALTAVTTGIAVAAIVAVSNPIYIETR